MSMPELPEGLKWSVERDTDDIIVSIKDARFTFAHETIRHDALQRTAGEKGFIEAVESAAIKVWLRVRREHELDIWIEKNWGTK